MNDVSNNRKKFEPNTSLCPENLESLGLSTKRPRSDSEYSSDPTGSESGDEGTYIHSGFAMKNFEFYFGPDKVLSTDVEEEYDDELLMEAESYAKEFGGRCLSMSCDNTGSQLLFECSMKHTWEMSLKNLHPCIKCT